MATTLSGVISLVAQSNKYNSEITTHMPPFTDTSDLQIAQCYLNPGQSWANGMWSSYFTQVAKSAKNMIVTIPMLVGTGWGSGAPGWAGPVGHTMSPQAPTDATGAISRPTLMSLTGVASGTWDLMFRKTFQSIAAARPDAILRIGWEMYGNWYCWGGKANASAHRAATQHLTTLARSVSSQFKFIWDGGAITGSGYNPCDPTTGAYPGDTYVDFIGADIYNESSVKTGPWGASGWVANPHGGLPYVVKGVAFAKAHGKPFCVPEFASAGATQGQYLNGAYGGGDDLPWIQAFVEWFTTTQGMAFALYWDDPTFAAVPVPKIAAWLGPELAKYCV